MREKFIEHRFTAASEALVGVIGTVVAAYEAQGMRLSLRQLFYRLVTMNEVENTPASYKNFGQLVSTARKAGLIDWDMIEDRNREAKALSHWDDPTDMLRTAAASYRLDKWAEQPFYVEVMVEKDALSGVLWPVCARLDVPFTANKGYSSSSTMYEAGKRVEEAYARGQDVVVFYLGDHDPSGLHMTEDIRDRLELYSNGAIVEVARLALNIDQIREWNLVENYAKQKDSRYADYRAKFGPYSWELDAVEPNELVRMVSEAVLARRDDEAWEGSLVKETEDRGKLERLADTHVF